MITKSFFALLALTCFGTAIAGSDFETAGQVSQTHGYVHVVLPYDALTVTAVDGGKKYRLRPRFEDNESLFGRWLPAGEYVFDEWSRYEVSGYPYFSVKAGRITDLGGLMEFDVGNNQYVLLPYRHPDIDVHFESVFETVRPFLGSEQVERWIPKNTPEPITRQGASGSGTIIDALVNKSTEINKSKTKVSLRDIHSASDFFDAARSALPPVPFEPAQDADGVTYYGALLGQIRYRSKDGDWGSIDTGTLASVTALEYFENRIAVGFSDGTIRWCSNTGECSIVWTHPKQHAVIDIDHTDHGWVALAARYERIIPAAFGVRVLEVLRGASLADITVIESNTIRGGSHTSFLPRGQTIGNSYFVNLYPRLKRLDLETDHWHDITPHKKVHSFSLSTDERMFTAIRIQGRFSKIAISGDFGESWTKIKNPPDLLQDFHLSDDSRGIAIGMKVKAFSSEHRLYEFERSSETWTLLTKVPNECSYFLRAINNDIAQCVTRGGSVLSHDSEEWQVEFSH